MQEQIYLSKSSLETFKQCGLKFNNRYVEKILGLQALQDKQAALFGTLIHEVLEKYFGNDKKGSLLSLYQEAFKNSEINSQDFYILGEQLLKHYAETSDNGNKVLGVEVEFKYFLDNGVPIKGIIDRIDEISEEEIEIIDYKTGYSTPLTPKQLETDLQLGMYNLAANNLFPKYKRVKLSLYYLHYGKISCYMSDTMLESLKGYLSVMYDKIQKGLGDPSLLTPTVNSFCSFCDYKATCTAFQETVKSSTELATIPKEYAGLIANETGLMIDVEKLDLFREMLINKQKLLKKVQGQTEDFIKNYIEKNGNSNRQAKIGNTYFSLASKKYTLYDTATFLTLCQRKGVNPAPFLETKKTDIDIAFKDDDEFLGILKSTAQTKFSNSYVK